MSAGGRARRRGRRALELASAGQTIVSLSLRRVDAGGPWPLTRVLTALGPLDVERVGVARALGDRHGVPLVHSQELRWQGYTGFLEVRHGRDGSDELTLELPPWDELARRDMHQDDLWGLIDCVANAADARFGSIGDGEPPETALPDGPAMLDVHLRRHLALLLPEWLNDDVEGAGASVARSLADSALLVVTA